MYNAEAKAERIWSVVAQIPAGRVASYGQVAALAGLPRAARLVGRVLRELPQDTRLPWHRVIRASGESAFPPGSAAWTEQRKRLREEGILWTGTRVSLDRYGWKP